MWLSAILLRGSSQAIVARNEAEDHGWRLRLPWQRMVQDFRRSQGSYCQVFSCFFVLHYLSTNLWFSATAAGIIVTSPSPNLVGAKICQSEWRKAYEGLTFDNVSYRHTVVILFDSKFSPFTSPLTRHHSFFRSWNLSYKDLCFAPVSLWCFWRLLVRERQKNVLICIQHV